MITVVVADDEALVRDGLIAIVNSDPDITVVGTATDGAGAVEAVLETGPDIVLMDVRMPGMDGIEATRRIIDSNSRTRILVLTTIDADDVVYNALRAGASGFLLKSVPREQLWSGIRAVAAGEALLAPSIVRHLIEAHLERGPALESSAIDLTRRQTDVVRLIAKGLTNSEIAAQLHLAETTVKGYVSEALNRHGLRDRAQLVVLAYESGLVHPGTHS